MIETGSIAGLGATAGAVMVVVLFLRHLSEQKKEDRIAQVRRDKLLASQLSSLGKLIKDNTVATKSSDEYLRQRNGRDIEKHAELIAATKEIPKTMQAIADAQSKAILKAVNIKNQHVENQNVDNQNVANKAKEPCNEDGK